MGRCDLLYDYIFFVKSGCMIDVGFYLIIPIFFFLLFLFEDMNYYLNKYLP